MNPAVKEYPGFLSYFQKRIREGKLELPEGKVDSDLKSDLKFITPNF